MNKTSRNERDIRDERPSRSRYDERPSRDEGRSSRDRGGERGGRGSGYEYTRRSAESVKNRANQTARDFDSYFKDGVKTYKTNEGDNCIRMMPPSWPGADHYGFDIWVHGYIGADNQSYLCPKKMLEKDCPICEELARAKKEDEDEKYIKSLEPKKRVVVYLVDRDDEKEGVQIWSMPWTVDRDICKVSQVDKRSGETLFIDDPENGYDVNFERKGTKDRTEYIGVSIARRESPLGNDKWLDYIKDNPIPDQLVYYDYDRLNKVLGGGGSHEDQDGARGRGRDEPSHMRGRDEADEDITTRIPHGQGSTRRHVDEGEPSNRHSERSNKETEAPTWSSIHKMTFDQMCQLIDAENLRIDPDKSKDDADLADWICEEMKIKDEPAPRRPAEKDGRDEPDPRDRLANMRRERESR